jgi:hypothetical protein
MKRSGFTLLATLLGFAASSAYAANVATSTMGATLVNAISIMKVTDLNFGQVVPGSSSGSVTVWENSGSRTPADGTTLGNTAGTSRASFTVTGAANATFAITNAGFITISDGTNSLTVNAFSSYPYSTSLSAGGTATIYVGATLNVPGNQAFNGTPFTGTFNTTVNYN